jgi:ABC-type nickel/cobalt efflux system permease component RcnA
MKNSVKRAALVAAFIIGISGALSANPFMGQAGQAQVNPVRAGATMGALVRGQLDLRDKLAKAFEHWDQARSSGLLLSILLIAFAYGVLHALGPGHRKTVAFSIYIARKAPWWEPMATSFALAGLHGGTAIALLFIFKNVAGAISGSTNTVSTMMEGLAYCLLILMALGLLTHSVISAATGKKHVDDNLSLGAMILSGVYPCPGAILVLVLSLTLNILGLGSLAVIAMSLGMSVPILAFAYLGWFGRAGLFARLKGNQAVIEKVSYGAEIVGFSVLLLFSVYIALPFLVSLPGYLHALFK